MIYKKYPTGATIFMEHIDQLNLKGKELTFNELIKIFLGHPFSLSISNCDQIFLLEMYLCTLNYLDNIETIGRQVVQQFHRFIDIITPIIQSINKDEFVSKLISTEIDSESVQSYIIVQDFLDFNRTVDVLNYEKKMIAFCAGSRRYIYPELAASLIDACDYKNSEDIEVLVLLWQRKKILGLEWPVNAISRLSINQITNCIKLEKTLAKEDFIKDIFINYFFNITDDQLSKLLISFSNILESDESPQWSIECINLLTYPQLKLTFAQTNYSKYMNKLNIDKILNEDDQELINLASQYPELLLRFPDNRVVKLFASNHDEINKILINAVARCGGSISVQLVNFFEKHTIDSQLLMSQCERYPSLLYRLPENRLTMLLNNFQSQINSQVISHIKRSTRDVPDPVVQFIRKNGNDALTKMIVDELFINNTFRWVFSIAIHQCKEPVDLELRDFILNSADTELLEWRQRLWK